MFGGHGRHNQAVDARLRRLRQTTGVIFSEQGKIKVAMGIDKPDVVRRLRAVGSPAVIASSDNASSDK
ncbi:hypothetical protein [Dickeya dadantii]|uniref:hypothetical protein n=1 Tax=Dickeya dadantii TaxID=204038 RepID=UPI001C12ED61|nr:hypothetical protein [Dickeya dadantii]